jgi:predicted ABC-type ATPase
MAKKRLRIFAGPNGSGKSTFIQEFQSKPNLKLGYYVNADDIEKALKAYQLLKLSDFGITITTRQIRHYFKNSTFSPVKLNDTTIGSHFKVKDNILIVSDVLKLNSYIAADIAEFIRQQLLKAKHSFSFETVMSDANKIDFLKKAKRKGFTIYVYFFATEDPIININRVALRVAQHGHSVNTTTIKKRYYKSLRNLKEAVAVSDRAYLFDNSGEVSILFAEITDGKEVAIKDSEHIPGWFVKYLLNV